MGKNKVKDRSKENLKEPNPTAEFVASHRAVESLKPENERICYDPYAIQFLKPETLEIINDPVKLKAINEMAGPIGQEMGTSLRIRVRYFDDFIERSVDNGLEQLVILGAGYDTRAYRINGLENVKVFEVDYPDTQHFKIQKIVEIFGFLSDHVVYVPVDLETHTLGQSLVDKGYESSKKTLFVMEGLIQYISPEYVDEIFSFIARNSGKGSAVIFDYHDESAINETSKAGKMIKNFLEQMGEHLKFSINKGEVEKFLSQHGFFNIISVSSAEYRNKYLPETDENEKFYNPMFFAHAMVDEKFY
ncbi:SAM-dependent methyltransferase [Methanobacterium petrolearium]|uniref:SAM-dependent methyltransferase n=1 Tax=Methanobacterium petrolearium TaxID=710190 RepID=UPI001AE683E1|nr:class I SAM-dependent methyltransferase [Methanobacterium petrolearium]MBP1946496.1 methyltransferase (TIGR00027 family) [Methanobacterium petrolearium]BDZ69834.1 SAM-dependent methyltransferase [Methanobacterium petrolearium]